MSWSVHTHNIPRIADHKRAEELWVEAVPWKSADESWRQLDSRRAQHKRLVRTKEGAIECVLYVTPMVTYHANGDVELRCDDSQTSYNFSWNIRPHNTRPHRQKQTMYWEVNTDCGPRFYQQGRDPLMLKATSPTTWELTTVPNQPLEWNYDPKKGAEVRRKLAPFKKWAELTQRLTGQRYTSGCYGGRFDAGYFLAHHTDIEIYPKMLEIFGSPDNLKKEAYLAAQARYEVPAPFYRLPRIQR